MVVETYDLVVLNGQGMDPETKLDAARIAVVAMIGFFIYKGVKK